MLKAIQRRYQNLYLDSARQIQYEIFLGLNLEKHLPSLNYLKDQNNNYILENLEINKNFLFSNENLECVSTYPAFCLKSMVGLFSNEIISNDIILNNDHFSWVIPFEYDNCEVIRMNNVFIINIFSYLFI